MFVMRYVEYIAKKWGIPVSMMLSFLFVPQTTVWVHDDVSNPQRGISQKIRPRANGARTMPQCGYRLKEVRQRTIMCDGTVKKFNAVWKAELDRVLFAGAKKMFGHCPRGDPLVT